MNNLAAHLIPIFQGHSAGAGRRRWGAITGARACLPVAALLLVPPVAWPDRTPSIHAVAVSRPLRTSGSWSPVAAMGVARLGHKAVVLRNGTVLVIGGSDVGNGIFSLSSAELFDRRSRTWTPTGSMLGSRYSFTATVLRNGEVLVTGGFETGVGTLATAELYDPRTGTWRATASMSVRRDAHTATLLRDGTVLVVGGFDGAGAVNLGAELYDPRSGAWIPTGSIGTGRALHTATPLRDGRVLVLGGSNAQGTTDSAELYDPQTGRWDPAASLSIPRVGHGATLLHDGSVLISGGCCFADGALLGSAELYDPHTDTWLPTGAMTIPRGGHNPVVLRTGGVLASGGCCQSPASDPEPEPPFYFANTEIYNPRTGTWQAEESMSVPRVGHTATLLRSGEVLVAGGANETDGVMARAEIFGPAR
jgi:hypothetical protein